MISHKQLRKNAFSLLEVVIVVAIIAILAAIGIPRMSRGSAGAADSSLKANLAILHNAIDLYAAEHQGSVPSAATVVDKLTSTSNANGDTGGVAADGYIYGPYLRKIPPLPVGTNKGNTGIADAAGEGVGWIYSNGGFTPNTGTDVDAEGHLYNDPNYYGY